MEKFIRYLYIFSVIVILQDFNFKDFLHAIINIYLSRFPLVIFVTQFTVYL